MAVLYGARGREETRTNPNGSCSRLYTTTSDDPLVVFVAHVTPVFCTALPTDRASFVLQLNEVRHKRR